MSDSARTVAEYWSDNLAGSDPFSPDVYWLAVPAVGARFQRRACAGKAYPSWVEYCVAEFLRPAGRERSRLLSLGCGSGMLERHLAALGAFDTAIGLDIAPGAIEAARRDAEAAGLRALSYEVRDIQARGLPNGPFDSVWFNGSLHHIEQLEEVCDAVRRVLAPDGWLFINEYVGANRFGFAARQREAMEAAFRLLPRRHRRSFVGATRGQVVEALAMPDPAETARADPSEAVRSQDILPVLRERFEIVALNACGGTLLQFVLAGIAGNFRADDADSMRMLELLFAIEDALVDSGDLPSDFVVMAARPR
jgi:SAM-dependent methyltransferase